MFSGTLTADRAGSRPLARVVERVKSTFANPAHAVRIALLLVAVAALVRTSAAPDLWGHVRFGGDIVAARSVPRIDPYSFTSDREWVNHEWLAEIAIFCAWKAGGAAGLIGLKIAILLLVVTIVSRTLRTAAVGEAGRDALLLLTVVGLLPRVMTVRPQVFSLVAFASLLALLNAADRGSRRARPDRR